MLRKIKNFLLFLVIILVAIGFFYNYQINSPAVAVKEPVVFNINEGEGVGQISQNLVDAGILNNSFWFKFYLKFTGLENKILAGQYTLENKISLKDLTVLITKRSNSEIKVLFREGLSNQEMAEILQESGLISAEEFLNTVGYDLGGFIEKYDFLEDKPASIDLEGYLFPDTYYFFKNASTDQIVSKMLNNFDRKLTPAMRSEIKQQNRTIFEIITLASIIEKEVGDPEDMRRVADIFYKRLEAGIALQSDATVNYITGKGHTQPLYTDTRIDNPYNTYKYAGLPPGPISNPGLNAIIAAIYPSTNPYYYFLTTPEGQVIYSVTYEEHLQNKNKYLD